MNLHQRHWVTFCNEINAITSVLDKHLVLRHFSHSYTNDEGYFFCIANDVKYPDYHFIEKKNPPLGWHDFDSHQSGIYCLNIDDDSVYGWPKGTIAEIYKRLDLENIIIMQNKFSHFMDSFMFSLDMRDGVPFFFNNQKLFQHFIYYYKDKAREIINYCKANLNHHLMEVMDHVN